MYLMAMQWGAVNICTEFMDSSEVSVVIRPDLTMPIGRFLATTNIELPRTFYYLGDVFMKNKSIVAMLTK